MRSFTTVRDLRNWVDDATTGWMERTNSDIEKLVECIRRDADFPGWGADCTAYLESLPDLCELLDDPV